MNTKWELLGKKLMGTAETVDVFEVFVVLFTFSEGIYDQKLKELFILFDFDGSGDIDFSELQLALQSVLIGFGKLLGLPAPSAAEVKTLAELAMESVTLNEAQQ